jgi:hypothetical protein
MKSVEDATRNYARGALRAFLEDDKYLNWLIGMIKSSGVQGSTLAEIFESLRGYGNGQRYEEAMLACRRQGWLP